MEIMISTSTICMTTSAHPTGDDNKQLMLIGRTVSYVKTCDVYDAFFVRVN